MDLFLWDQRSWIGHVTYTRSKHATDTVQTPYRHQSEHDRIWNMTSSVHQGMIGATNEAEDSSPRVRSPSPLPECIWSDLIVRARSFFFFFVSAQLRIHQDSYIYCEGGDFWRFKSCPPLVCTLQFQVPIYLFLSQILLLRVLSSSFLFGTAKISVTGVDRSLSVDSSWVLAKGFLILGFVGLSVFALSFG